MKISYDKKADAFSIVLKEGRVSRDEPIGKNSFAGYDREGNLVEIQILEVLPPIRQLAESGCKTSIPLDRARESSLI